MLSVPRRLGANPLVANCGRVGTAGYVAPEMFLGLNHSFPVDWWASPSNSSANPCIPSYIPTATEVVVKFTHYAARL